MSNLIRQWYCPVCKTVKAREDFPRHIDRRTPCLDCQRGIQRQHDAEGATPVQEQPVYVRRVVKTPRNHDRDHE